MTGTELAVQSTAYSRANLTERQQYVKALAAAGDLLPKDLVKFAPLGPNGQMIKVGDPGKVMLMAETGDMLGIHPMAALVGVHIIEGRPSISANLMGGLVRKAGHKLRVQTQGSIEDGTLEATATLVREDDPDYPFVVTWNVGKATRAGLLPGKESSNWRKYPDAMMKARAISEVIREGAPDVLMGGNVYTPEEMGAVVDEQGEPVEMTQVRETQPPAAPKQQAPIVDPQAADPEPTTEEPSQPETAAEEAFDWGKAAANVADSAEARVLYQRAKSEGVLNLKVKQGRKNRELGDLLTEIGKGLIEAERAAAEAAENDVVVAEVVEDGESMALGGDES